MKNSTEKFSIYAENKIRAGYLNLIAVIGFIITVLPFLWMIFTSFKSPGEIFVFPPRIIPRQFTLQHYEKLFRGVAFLHHFKNSVIITGSILVLSLFLNSFAAFAFAKHKFPGKEKIFGLLLATMMIPGQMTMIPIFLLLRQMGLLNTYLGVIVTGATSVFGIFLIRQFMLTIPDDLIDAARVDGCSEFQIYYKIMLPLCKPILSTLGIFTFLGSWNDFLWPLIVMIKKDMFPLTVALANLNSQYGTDYGLLMAAATIVILPVIIVFLIGQKYIIRSIAVTGLKE